MAIRLGEQLMVDPCFLSIGVVALSKKNSPVNHSLVVTGWQRDTDDVDFFLWTNPWPERITRTMLGVNRQDGVSSLIGPGTSLRGELEFQGTLRIDGTFNGSIKTPGTLVVGKEATVEGDVRAGQLQVFGRVQATVDVDQRVEIYEGGALKGDVRTPSLVIEEGAQFEGLSSKMPKTNQDDLQPAREDHSSPDEESELEEARPVLQQSALRSTPWFAQFRLSVQRALKRQESVPSGNDSL
jgi:cytoskeletal protein CcmA (bactofilin family)